MRQSRRRFLVRSVLLPLLGPPAAALAAESIKEPGDPNLPDAVQRFIRAKEDQVKAAAKRHQVDPWPEVADFFAAVRKGDLEGVETHFDEMRQNVRTSQGSELEHRVGYTTYQAALEVKLILDQFIQGEPKFAEAIGREIVASMPKGSIYFGGTDSGRGLPTAFCSSHAKGEPVFVLTQNALADGGYLIYLRDMFGEQIYVPTSKDSEKAFQDYLADAQRRLDHDEKFPNEPRQVKPGEDIRRDGNRVSVSGQVAVMSINALLARIVFNQNPTRQFFIEESFPLEWMYPHLSPHGLILKLNRKPLDTLSEDALKQDRKFWSDQQRKLIGAWLTPETPVKKICQFAEEVWVEKDLDNYEVDPKFVRKNHAGRTYSKLRSAIGGVYAWRANQTKDAAERDRLLNEADFAFRQAVAFCPGSPEAVFRYINLLVEKKRFDDALCLTEVAGRIDPGAGNFRSLEKELQRLKAAEAK